jgi:aerobic-type carbon monoxide dehydrogenase small subunit (CoxS/CutS family)
MSAKLPVALDVNGETHEILVPASKTLLDVLRQDLHLTGAKRACNQGVCGSCTVLLDGDSVRACLCLAVNCEGQSIVTIEGLADGGRLSIVQQAFVDAGAIQCGFCMPGFIIAATALLKENASPSEAEIRDGIAGNLCRCSGYVKVIDAVRLASAKLADAAGKT